MTLLSNFKTLLLSFQAIVRPPFTPFSSSSSYPAARFSSPKSTPLSLVLHHQLHQGISCSTCRFISSPIITTSQSSRTTKDFNILYFKQDTSAAATARHVIPVTTNTNNDANQFMCPQRQTWALWGWNHDTHLFTQHNWIKCNQGRCCCYSVLTYSEKWTYFGKILLSCLQGEIWQACFVVTGIRLVGVLMCAGWCHASRRRCFLSDETAGQQTWGDVMISESLRTCVEVVLLS